MCKVQIEIIHFVQNKVNPDESPDTFAGSYTCL